MIYMTLIVRIISKKNEYITLVLQTIEDTSIEHFYVVWVMSLNVKIKSLTRQEIV